MMLFGKGSFTDELRAEASGKVTCLIVNEAKHPEENKRVIVNDTSMENRMLNGITIFQFEAKFMTEEGEYGQSGRIAGEGSKILLRPS